MTTEQLATLAATCDGIITELEKLLADSRTPRQLATEFLPHPLPKSYFIDPLDSLRHLATEELGYKLLGIPSYDLDEPDPRDYWPYQFWEPLPDGTCKLTATDPDRYLSRLLSLDPDREDRGLLTFAYSVDYLTWILATNTLAAPQTTDRYKPAESPDPIPTPPDTLTVAPRASDRAVGQAWQSIPGLTEVADRAKRVLAEAGKLSKGVAWAAILEVYRDQLDNLTATEQSKLLAHVLDLDSHRTAEGHRLKGNKKGGKLDSVGRQQLPRIIQLLSAGEGQA